MPLNNAGMQVAANALRGALLYAQLHSWLAGASYTDNVCTSGREAITWAATSGLGDFALSAQLEFNGGAASGAIYSCTLWSAASNGTCYGEFPIGNGDLTFNSNGDYFLTVADFIGIINAGS